MTSGDISGLLPFLNHSVEVAASTSKGMGPRGAPAYTLTDEYGEYNANQRQMKLTPIIEIFLDEMPLLWFVLLLNCCTSTLFTLKPAKLINFLAGLWY